MHDETSPYYPIFLNIRGKKCLVVGGGKIALRKVQALLECGANVQVVGPILCPELRQLAESDVIQAFQRSYKAEDLQDALIAIAATDDVKTNESVAAEARRQRILINVVDDPQHSDLIAPSYFRRGAVTIAVSTSGRSPALARKLKSKLEKDFGTEHAKLAVLASEVRTELKQQKIAVDTEAWQEALDLNLLTELLKDGKIQEAKDTLLKNLKASGKRKR